MKTSAKRMPAKRIRALLLPCMLLALSTPLSAQEAAEPTASAAEEPASAAAIPAQAISAEAQAVLDRMTSALQNLSSYSIEADGSRDEVVALGYKLQNNEHAELVVQRPNKLRAEVSGDVRNRTFVYDGAKLLMYSPDDAVFTRIEAPDSVGGMIEKLLDSGVEMPLIDVLYQASTGALTEGVRNGILVGTSTIDGVECDHLAFRQADIDWQLWVEQGARALPRKLVITTRYEVGDPQYQATLRWNLKPKIQNSTFVFTAPKGVNEIAFNKPSSGDGSAP